VGGRTTSVTGGRGLVKQIRTRTGCPAGFSVCPSHSRQERFETEPSRIRHPPAAYRTICARISPKAPSPVATGVEPLLLMRREITPLTLGPLPGRFGYRAPAAYAPRDHPTNPGAPPGSLRVQSTKWSHELLLPQDHQPAAYAPQDPTTTLGAPTRAQRVQTSTGSHERLLPENGATGVSPRPAAYAPRDPTTNLGAPPGS
jgi:hypothetical protein